MSFGISASGPVENVVVSVQQQADNCHFNGSMTLIQRDALVALVRSMGATHLHITASGHNAKDKNDGAYIAVNVGGFTPQGDPAEG